MTGNTPLSIEDLATFRREALLAQVSYDEFLQAGAQFSLQNLPGANT